MTSHPDVVVVGAGVNGLVCAAYLARAGLRVTVLESRAEIGGCAPTVPGWGARVDAGTGHPSLHAGPIIEELALAEHGLRYLEPDPCLLAVGWERRSPFVLFADPARTLDALAATHPGSVEAYARYLRVAQPAARLLLELAHQVPNPARAVRALLSRRGRGAATLLSWSRRPAASVLRAIFPDEDLAAVACVTGPARLGLPPNAPRTGLAALGYALHHVAPAARPVGGDGMVARALRAALEAAGGSVRTGAAVTTVLAVGDRARGVVLADGEEVEAGAVVIACDARRAIVSWLRDPPPIARDMVERWRAGRVRDGFESTLGAVVCGPPPRLELPPGLADRLAIAEPAAARGIVHPGIPGLERNHWELGPGRVARRPALVLQVPTALDPSLRPGGSAGRRQTGHVLHLQVLWTPYALAGGWEGSSEPERWLGLLDLACGPGTVDRLQDWRALTPPDHERELGRVRGRRPSFAGGPVAALRARDPERARYRTPVRGLFLASGDTFPGPAVPGAAGRNAAAVVLASVGERARRPSAGRRGDASGEPSRAAVAAVEARPAARRWPRSLQPPPGRTPLRSGPRPIAPR